MRDIEISLSADQPLDPPRPEWAAHAKRVTELTRRLTERFDVPTDRAREICSHFDHAVEYAVCEGRRVDDVLAEFFTDGWGAEGMALAGVAGYFHEVFRPDSRKLPVLPKAASRLLRLTDDSAAATDLEQIVASEPVLTAKLLGAANSALLGSGFEIVHLREAILRIGIPQARRVALTGCLSGLFASRPLRDVWEHSLRIARLAFDLAQLCELNGSVEPESAYLAGLVHDIGRLGMLTAPAMRRVVEQNWFANGFPRVYAEMLAYGVDHAALGAIILGSWELPECIVEAVALHHQPGRSESLLPAVLYLAEDLQAQDALEPHEDLWPAMRRQAACRVAGIDPRQLRLYSDTRHAAWHTACA